MGRPRRAAARAAADMIQLCAPARGKDAGGMPSAVHYVGYVEDDETPEMIMRKFQALEVRPAPPRRPPAPRVGAPARPPARPAGRPRR